MEDPRLERRGRERGNPGLKEAHPRIAGEGSAQDRAAGLPGTSNVDRSRPVDCQEVNSRLCRPPDAASCRVGRLQRDPAGSGTFLSYLPGPGPAGPTPENNYLLFIIYLLFITDPKSACSEEERDDDNEEQGRQALGRGGRGER